MKPFILKLDGQEHIIEPDECEVRLFRERPDMDYLSVDDGDEEEHREMWVFNRREICLWIGNIVPNANDKEDLRTMNKEHGSFKKHCGWLGRVVIESIPTQFEEEMYIASLMKDLKNTDYIPKAFYKFL